VKWYTRTLEVRMPKGVEVQVLSRAPGFPSGRLAQLVRALRLHRRGHRSEPYIVHRRMRVTRSQKCFIMAVCSSQASQVGHGACLKNTKLRFDSSAWHCYLPSAIITILLRKLNKAMAPLVRAEPRNLRPVSAAALDCRLKSGSL
jgi:hypothetical protein